MAEPASFEKLREKRLRYVESARENDFEEGLKSLLSELYPDNAHFIYELLQNAEDARATSIEFSLDHDYLTVTHDGKRLFSLADIKQITGIGNSAKKDDPTQIGKFGVGFKAVFAYTTRPEVRSGEHAFAVDDLFVPTEISGAAKPGETTFIFPFDRADKPATTACEEVKRGLLELNEKTLLFLNHISAITYELSDGTVGTIERQEIDDRVIRIKKSEGDEFVESHWLRLKGPASVEHEGANPLTVAVAFRIEIAEDSKSKRGKQTKESHAPSGSRCSFVLLKDGDVSIYFPAVKESSGLRFHIHAPFASTVARDSVRDDPGNVRLVEDIAALIVNALPGLRDQGLIVDSFLATLPNQDDQIGHLYSRIQDAITEAFNNLEITPVRGSGGGYAAARALVTSPSEFRNWLDASDLPVLFSLAGIETAQLPRWIRDRDGRAGKFLAGLATIEFGWEELSTATETAERADEVLADTDGSYEEEDKAAAKTWFSWLEGKDDDSLLRFYQLLGSGCGDGEIWSDLSEVPIIRLRRRGRAKHVKGPDTYLPSSRSDTVNARVPVELAYFEDDEDQSRANNLKAFYRAAGVERWNESAKIKQRLARYKEASRSTPDGDDLTRHLKDVRSFVRHGLSNRQTARAMFADVPFLLSPQSDGSARWVNPRRTFLDLPFRDSGLSVLYSRVKLNRKNAGGYANDQDPYPLAGFYLDVESIEDFLDVVGARVGIEITKAEVTTNPQFSWSWRHNNRESYYGERVDWGIEHLDVILEIGDQDLLRTLWRAVVAAPVSKASAFYQANGSSRRYPMDSQLAQTLKSKPWVLDRNGDLKRPSQMTAEDLPDDWQQPAPTSLVYKLDFGAEAAKRRQKQQGVTDFLREEGLDEDGIDFLRETKERGLTIADLRALVRAREGMTRFPEGASDDPVRRAGVAALDAITAPQHSTDIRERSVVEDQAQASAESKAYLRGQYTDAAGDMFCQACRRLLPFKTRDGLWYFEAVRFVNARKQVHTTNAIALCPLCAALYKYARQTKNEAVLEQLASTTIDAGQGLVEVPVVLNSKRVKIAFTGKHAIDIKTALGVAGDDRADEG